MGTTNDFFLPGKISLLLDQAHGSSGKSKAAMYLMENSDNCHFMCNAFMPQASHTVVDETGTYIYKQLNSAAHKHHLIEKMYIGQGAVIDLQVLLHEIEMTGLPPEKLGISPICTILQPMDKLYEEGKAGFDGEILEQNHEGTISTGSTCSGVGAARARKILRRPNLLIARNIPELQQYLCDVPGEIMERIAKGQSGLLEIAQGFPLSIGIPEMFPHTTSRNVTIAAALDDMMLPVTCVGNVLLNLRTYPIRIHSKKYISTGNKVDEFSYEENPAISLEEYLSNLNDSNPRCEFRLERTDMIEKWMKPGIHLTWDEVQSGLIPHDVIESNSGPWYPDQQELTWEELTEISGSPQHLMECTTLTKLPRRVATFSKKNFEDAIIHNQTPHKIFVSLNFVNYVDWELYRETDFISDKLTHFLHQNIYPVISKFDNVELRYLGTGERTSEMILLDSKENSVN